MLDTDSIRAQFPYLHEVLDLRIPNPHKGKRIFLDNTASTQIPFQVLENLGKTIFNYANVHRGEYDASQESTEEFERAYNTAANLVNADSWQEIIFGRNTTEMINLVMRCLQDDFKNRDNIVTTRLEHNSNYVPWYGLQQKLAKKGENIEIRLADFDRETGSPDLNQLEGLIDKRTKIVTVTGASNFIGIKPDIKLIGQLAHSSGYRQPDGRKGSYFLVDGAQLVPGNPVDTQDIGCDFLAWSFHKMALPLGVGGLYAKKNVIENFDPFLFGGDMIEDVKEGAVEYKELPWKYTAGTPNILGTIAAGKGITFLMNAGLGQLYIGNPDTKGKIHQLCKQIETDIVMNTPRGKFETPFTVSQEYQEFFKQYLRANPEIARTLRDPKTRLKRARETVKSAMGSIMLHEQELTQYAIDNLSQVPGVILYGTKDAKQRVGLIALNIKNMDPQAVAFELNKTGVEVRNGNHCASLAHEYIGVNGTVRLSFYIYNTPDEIDKAVDEVNRVSKEAGNN